MQTLLLQWRLIVSIAVLAHTPMLLAALLAPTVLQVKPMRILLLRWHLLVAIVQQGTMQRQVPQHALPVPWEAVQTLGLELTLIVALHVLEVHMQTW